MQFNQIILSSLNPNEKYKIKCGNHEFRGTFYKYDLFSGFHFTKIKQDEFCFPDTSLRNITCYQPIFLKEKNTTKHGAPSSKFYNS